MKLVAYVRVSTDRQTEQGLGLDVQRQGIRRWAKTNGHRIVEWYADEGVSGSNGVETRTGLLDALSSIADEQAKGLVVFKLDRLARSLTVQEGTLSKIWAMGASMFSVDLGEVPKDDPDDPMRTALRQIIGVFAELERGMISARLRAGRRLKAERGGYSYGAPPFGFRAEDKALVEDHDEQLIVSPILALHDDGASLREIASTLNAEGHQPRRSKSWQSAVSVESSSAPPRKRSRANLARHGAVRRKSRWGQRGTLRHARTILARAFVAVAFHTLHSLVIRLHSACGAICD